MKTLGSTASRGGSGVQVRWHGSCWMEVWKSNQTWRFSTDITPSTRPKEAGPKQIFSSASEYSSLIIEYVQRFGDFQGFFTRDKVAELTRAAGVDESLKALEAEASV